MIIDKLSDKTFTPFEITTIAQDEIAKIFNRDAEANIQRVINGAALGLRIPTQEEEVVIQAYKTLLESVLIETDQAKIDNQLLIDTINYEKAKRRIEQYELSIGRPEYSFIENGETILINAIDPLPLTIQKTEVNENGQEVIITIDNPVITNDINERTLANEVINNATTEVIELYEIRNPL